MITAVFFPPENIQICYVKNPALAEFVIRR